MFAFSANHRAESSDSAETSSDEEMELSDCEEPTDSDLTTTTTTPDEPCGAVDERTVMEVSNASNSICVLLPPICIVHNSSQTWAFSCCKLRSQGNIFLGNNR